MAEIAFTEPPQAETIKKIPRGHQSGVMVGSLWRSSTAGTPPAMRVGTVWTATAVQAATGKINVHGYSHVPGQLLKTEADLRG